MPDVSFPLPFLASSLTLLLNVSIPSLHDVFMLSLLSHSLSWMARACVRQTVTFTVMYRSLVCVNAQDALRAACNEYTHAPCPMHTASIRPAID
ncbi:uncharacterized protein LAESUDRAFT_105074 [Laetiporus sulphureus 93-53]|uniref:Uncharacterized protein n=1 Tax=Laetiporus sulphureus 93-53 TaxID=1314785 RepID=A0A165EU38_9APHY|nr:uncharacterized protein LAESUDRAFT_105074 [Laetiporus sulphureus 93-53]KZT07765.1 hypothetical protein LAESUDRAFT_105074 [Laetiporus sulphureus 93-53]